MLTEEEMMHIQTSIDSFVLEDGSRGSIDRDSFVEMMAETFRKNRNLPRCPDVLVEQLHELFLGIDLDAGGSVSWDEFSTYVLEAMAAVGAHAEVIPNYHCRHVSTRPGTHKGKQFNRTFFHYFDTLDKFLVCDLTQTETKASVLSSTSLRSITTFDVPHVATTVEYIPSCHSFIFALATGTMLSYAQKRRDTSSHDILATPFQLENQSFVECAPTLMKWSPQLDCLFTATRQGNIISYKVDNDSYACEVVQNFHIHSDPIMDFITVPKHNRVFTCSMNGGLKVSSLLDGRKQLSIGEFKDISVRTMSYHEDTNVLLTSGFDLEPQLWMLVDSKNQLVGKLFDGRHPHKHPILAAYCTSLSEDPEASASYLATTVDESGLVKLWDLRKLQCVQSLYVEPTLTPDQFKSFHVTHALKRNTEIVVTATSLTRHMNVYRLRPQDQFSKNTSGGTECVLTGVLYNWHLQQIVCFVDKTMTVFDAKTGKIAFQINELAQSIVTAATLDDKGRRIMFGTHTGDVSMVSASTGSRIADYDPHDAEITSMCYCSHPRFFITASADKTVRVYSERSSDESEPLFVLPFSHHGMCVEYSSRLSLFAVGDSGETISVYDAHNSIVLNIQRRFTTTKLKSLLGFRREVSSQLSDEVTPLHLKIHEYVTPPVCEIVCVTFLEPYPAIAFGDNGAVVSVMGTRPYPFSSEVKCMWRTSPPKSIATNIVNVTTSMLFDGEVHQLFTADDQGWIMVWNLHDLIQHLSLKPCAFPPSPEIVEEYSTLKEPTMYQRSPTKLREWKVYKGCITSMKWMDKSHFICGTSDGVVLIIHRQTGENMGVVSLSERLIPKEYLGIPYTAVPPAPLGYEESSQAYVVEECVKSQDKQRTTVLWGHLRGHVGQTSQHSFRSIVVSAMHVHDIEADEESVTPPSSPPHARTPPGSPTITVGLWPKHFIEGTYRVAPHHMFSVKSTRELCSITREKKCDDKHEEHRLLKFQEEMDSRQLRKVDVGVESILQQAAQQLSKMIPPECKTGVTFLRKRLKPWGIPQHVRALLYVPKIEIDTKAPQWVLHEARVFQPHTFTYIVDVYSRKPKMMHNEEQDEGVDEGLFAMKRLSDAFNVKESDFMYKSRRLGMYSPLMPKPNEMWRQPDGTWFTSGGGKGDSSMFMASFRMQSSGSMRKGQQPPWMTSLPGTGETPQHQDLHPDMFPDEADSAVSFEQLLQISAPLYPLMTSPYLDLQRSAPSVSPAVFLKLSKRAPGVLDSIVKENEDFEEPQPVIPPMTNATMEASSPPPTSPVVVQVRKTTSPELSTSTDNQPKLTSKRSKLKRFSPKKSRSTSREPTKAPIPMRRASMHSVEKLDPMMYIRPPRSLLNPVVYGADDVTMHMHHNIPHVRPGSALGPEKTDVRRVHMVGSKLESRRIQSATIRTDEQLLTSQSIVQNVNVALQRAKTSMDVRTMSQGKLRSVLRDKKSSLADVSGNSDISLEEDGVKLCGPEVAPVVLNEHKNPVPKTVKRKQSKKEKEKKKVEQVEDVNVAEVP
eukprot:PhF_6_TR10057/c0_g1_i2/m.15540